jgi:hypothetical protein
MRTDPTDTGGLFIGRRPGTGPGSLGIVVSCLGVLAAVLGGLVVLKRLDQFWILVRRAAGYDQRSGVIGSVFAGAAIIGVALFVAAR